MMEKMSKEVKGRPEIRMERIPNNNKQIRILRFEPGQQEPFEILMDVIPVGKRSDLKKSVAH